MQGHAPRQDAFAPTGHPWRPPANQNTSFRRQGVIGRGWTGRAGSWTPFSPSFLLRFFSFPGLIPGIPRIRGAEMPPTASRPGQDPARGPRVFTPFLLLEPVPRGTRHAFEPEVSHRRVTCPGECQVSPSSEPRAWTLFYGAGLSGAAADFIHQPGAVPTVMLNL